MQIRAVSITANSIIMIALKKSHDILVLLCCLLVLPNGHNIQPIMKRITIPILKCLPAEAISLDIPFIIACDILVSVYNGPFKTSFISFHISIHLKSISCFQPTQPFLIGHIFRNGCPSYYLTPLIEAAIRFELEMTFLALLFKCFFLFLAHNFNLLMVQLIFLFPFLIGLIAPIHSLDLPHVIFPGGKAKALIGVGLLQEVVVCQGIFPAPVDVLYMVWRKPVKLVKDHILLISLSSCCAHRSSSIMTSPCSLPSG